MCLVCPSHTRRLEPIPEPSPQPTEGPLDFLPRVSARRLTLQWDVRATQTRVYLGRIGWHSPWRRYVYSPAPTTLLDAAALREMARFLDEQTKTQHEVAARRRIQDGAMGG